jgi:pullulanase
MPLAADLLDRKRTQFVLWHPKPGATAGPVLVIGRFQAGNPPTLANEQRFALAPVAGLPDLFAINAANCNLNDGAVYHYWFEAEDSDSRRNPPQRLLCSDPMAWTVDWRLRAPRTPAPFTPNDRQPAAVAKFSSGQLLPSDPAGEESDLTGDPSPNSLPANNRLVIYEMPTAWARFVTSSR